MLCRVCLQTSSDGFAIFEAQGVNLRVAEILTKHLFFKPKVDDPISTNICSHCWCILLNFNEFYERIEKEHQIYFANCVLKHDQQNPNEQDRKILAEADQTEDCDATGLLALETVKSETTDGIHLEDLQDTDPLAEDLSTKGETVHRENDDKIDYDSDDIVLSALKKPAPRKRAKRSKAKTEVSGLSLAEKNAQFDTLISDSIKLLCNECKQESGTFAELLEHKRLVHMEEQPYFFCCQHKYFKRYHLVQHIKQKHSSQRGDECPICHKVVLHLKIHLMCTHAKEEELKFTCDRCSRKFVRSYLLRQHKVRCGRQETNILCERCHKKFSHLFQLRRHMIVHQVAGDAVPWETYNCEKCTRVFTYPYQLKEHMAVHGEAPHKCDVCQKGFARSENLAKHMKKGHSPKKLTVKKKKEKAKAIEHEKLQKP